MPIMVDQSQSAANLQMFLSCVRIIDDHVVVVNGRATLKETESAAHSGELIHVDAGNRVEEFERLNDCAGYKRNVRFSAENCQQAVTHWSGAYRRKSRRPRGTK